MSDCTQEVLNRILELKVDCPDCDWNVQDEQYTCPTCQCEGGQGTIVVRDFLKEESGKRVMTNYMEIIGL